MDFLMAAAFLISWEGDFMDAKVLYHGSAQIVEFPEIRPQNITRIFTLDFIVPFFRNKPEGGHRDSQGKGY